MFSKQKLVSIAKTLLIYTAAGYYLGEAIAVLRSLEPPAMPAKVRLPRPRPCPCTARAAAGAHAAPEASGDGA